MTYPPSTKRHDVVCPAEKTAANDEAGLPFGRLLSAPQSK